MKTKRSRFKQLTAKQEEFLIKRLEKEWLDIELSAKRHELAEYAKRIGASAGKAILCTLLVAGIVTVAAVAPNVFAIFSPKNHSRRRYLKADHLSYELNKGSSKSWWRYKKTGDGKYEVCLTPRGRKIALHNTLRDFKLRQAKHWDGRYRMVIFDIPRKHNSARDGFRRRLLEMGMHPLQNSVFVYPYPCKEEAMFWASLFNVSENVHIADSKLDTDIDSHLRELFGL